MKYLVLFLTLSTHAAVFADTAGQAAHSGHPNHIDAVDFSLPDVDGNEIRLSDFRGQWVIVNFWASWCGPCIKEIPELVSYQKAHPDNMVLGINFEKLGPDAIRRFAGKWGINYPILRIGERPLIPFEPLDGLPATFVVSPSGELVTDHTGPVTQEMLEVFIRQEQSFHRQ